jgi:hypothetical protein
VFELTGVFIATVMPAASLVIFGSTFSSRQFVIHYAVLSPQLVVAGVMLVVSLRRDMNKEMKRRVLKMKTSSKTAPTLVENNALSSSAKSGGDLSDFAGSVVGFDSEGNAD